MLLKGAQLGGERIRLRNLLITEEENTAN